MRKVFGSREQGARGGEQGAKGEGAGSKGAGSKGEGAGSRGGGGEQNLESDNFLKNIMTMAY